MWVCPDNFEYIIVPKIEEQKICFGSGLPRDTSRTSPFMRYYTFENYPNVGPGSYNILESFKATKTKPCSHSISKRGYSGLGRFHGITKPVYIEELPSPFYYDLPSFPKPVKPLKYPFASTAERKIFDVNKNPGPGMYRKMKLEKDKIKYEHSFGGKINMKLGIYLKCCSHNTDTCKLCGEKPKGDYWHLNNKIFLCRICMAKEFQQQVKFKRKELKLFGKIRDCSAIHIHEGTDAKIWLTHPILVKQWTRREAYLSPYFKD